MCFLSDAARQSASPHQRPSATAQFWLEETLATAWLDREPSEHEWNRTLAVLWSLNAHTSQADGSWRAVTPHLLARPDGAIPGYSNHTLKRYKITAYVGARVHPDYAVEPGAHAGSRLERMSVRGAEQHVDRMRPSGLGTALRYARAALDLSVAEVDATVMTAVREWIAHVGLGALPRTNSWPAFTAWATQRAPESVVVGREDGRPEADPEGARRDDDSDVEDDADPAA